MEGRRSNFKHNARGIKKGKLRKEKRNQDLNTQGRQGLAQGSLGKTGKREKVEKKVGGRCWGGPHKDIKKPDAQSKQRRGGGWKIEGKGGRVSGRGVKEKRKNSGGKGGEKAQRVKGGGSKGENRVYKRQSDWEKKEDRNPVLKGRWGKKIARWGKLKKRV